MSTAAEKERTAGTGSYLDSEHRLGLRGKWKLPKSLVQSASDHGLVIRPVDLETKLQAPLSVEGKLTSPDTLKAELQLKESAQSAWLKTKERAGRTMFHIESAQGHSVSSILPGMLKGEQQISREDLTQALSRLHQPLRTIANNIADVNTETDVDQAVEDILEIDDARKKIPEFVGKEIHGGSIDTSVIDYLQADRKARAEETSELLRENLYRSIGFISRGSVQEEELHNGGHGDYDDHDDGCEVVAEDMEKAEAKKNASETSGLLLEGFRFSRKYGKYRLSLHEDFVKGEFETPAQQQLHATLKTAIERATGGIEWSDNPDKVYLNGTELERFCDSIYEQTLGKDAKFNFAIEDVLREEINTQDIENVDAKAEELEQSEWLQQLSALNPEAKFTAAKRMTQLSTAISVMQVLVDNPEMQAIWEKYNITGSFFKTEDSPLEGLCADFERLQQVIDRNIEEGKTSLTDLEAIAVEFRDTIAGGREIVSILDKAINSAAILPEGASNNTLHLRHLDKMLAGASIAPTTLPRSQMSSEAKEIAHYVGRHTRQEGVDLAEGFADFIDDFGGEVVDFVWRNKVLTTALGVTFYFAMSSAAQGPDGGAMNTVQAAADGMSGIVSAGGTGFDANASITDLLNSKQPLEITPMHIDDIERQYGSQAIEVCHFHLPVKVPYFEHCLISDQAVKQLQDGYALIKGPLNTVLNTPADGIDILAPRAEGTPPVYAIDSFKDSLRTTGEAWFVANGYQNLAHAPWAAVAGSMGYKLGVIPSIRKTSGLITPLIDGAYGLTRDNAYLLGTIPAMAYGYSEQGLSGAVMATTLSATSAYGLSFAQNSTQKALELLPHGIAVQTALPEKLRHGVKTSANIIKLTDYSAKKEQALLTIEAPEGYLKTGTGLLVPAGTAAGTVEIQHAAHDGGVSTTSHDNEHVFTGSEQGTEANDNTPSFKALDEELETPLAFKVGGKQLKIDLNAETYKKLVQDLTEFAFLLEHAPDKLGVTEENEEPDNEKAREEAEYKEAQLEAVKDKLGIDRSSASKVTDWEYDEFLKRSVTVSLERLQQYADGEISARALENTLQEHTETILSAKLVHLADAGADITKQQEKALSIKGHATQRLFDREAGRREDHDHLAQLAFNAGRSVNNFKGLPGAVKKAIVTGAKPSSQENKIVDALIDLGGELSLSFKTTASLGLKTASTATTLGKMGIRNSWSFIRDDIVPTAQLGYNSLSPKTKGNIIGGGLLATAFALKVDADPAAQQALQELLPFGGEAVADGVKASAGYVGTAGGAATATGLFAVYNFGEDHLIIHISMGYACIVAGGGTRVAMFPVHKMGQAAEFLTEELADISKGYLDARHVSRGAASAYKSLQRLTRDIQNYDQNHLPSLAA